MFITVLLLTFYQLGHMKVLYAIQGTGNGHLSRARDIIPSLKKYCELDILLSGHQSEVNLPYEINYQCRGLSFILGKNGGIDFLKTIKEAKLTTLWKEINEIPVEQYDLVINDFEPVSAWACYKKQVPCIALSHQAAVIHPSAPKPKTKNLIGSMVLKKYAPSKRQFGFHFDAYSDNIYTPVIRKEIREAIVEDKGHYTVYLPSYGDQYLISFLSQFNTVRWHVFSKQLMKEKEVGHIRLMPINNKRYIDSLRQCKGLLCNAGFEGPAEAIYLGKKLMVSPQQGQYEQHCNATAIERLGVPVIKKLNAKHLKPLQDWLASTEIISVQFPNNTDHIIQTVLNILP